MKYDINNLDSKKVGSITLNKDIFGVPIRKDILKNVVNWQFANRRQGSTKLKHAQKFQVQQLKHLNKKELGELEEEILKQIF